MAIALEDNNEEVLIAITQKWLYLSARSWKKKNDSKFCQLTLKTSLFKIHWSAESP